MNAPSRLALTAASLLVMLVGCKDDGAPADTDAAATEGDDGAGSGAGEAGEAGESGDDGPVLPDGHAHVVHSFGTYALAPLEETQPCIQWSLDNEQAVYVNKVTLTNNGGYHHSNWFVVPEWFAAGDDGFFDCDSRGFTELAAAVEGTVLTAQSTQSRHETMALPEGVVIKIPPKHKIVAGGHLLNLADGEYPTELRMTLEIVHPSLVEVVAAPFRLSYLDLDIPPFSQSRFSGTCDFASLYESQAGRPLDLTLYYVLPHYHYLGNFFELDVVGGPRDGENVFRLDGFNADANGRPIDPPLDMTGATGFHFTCGYDNWRDVSIGWGIGDQEMCVMLGLADSAVLIDASVSEGALVGEQDGIPMSEGGCAVIGLPKNPAQSMPTPEEIAGELYMPPTNPGDADLPPLPECVDAPADALPLLAPTLSNIRDTVFVASCEFSSCHGGAGAVAGLDLRAEDLHAELLGHELTLTETDMRLVEPGDPERSWLYQAISRCAPGGTAEPHMPLNAVELIDPRQAAMVRAWIAAGAPND